MGRGLATGDRVHIEQESMRRHVRALGDGLRGIEDFIEELRIGVGAGADIAQVGTDPAFSDEDGRVAEVGAGVAAALAPLALNVAATAFLADLLGVAGDATEILVNEPARVGEAGAWLRVEGVVHRILELAEPAELMVRVQQQAGPGEREGGEDAEEKGESVFHGFTTSRAGGARNVAMAVFFELIGQARKKKLMKKAT